MDALEKGKYPTSGSLITIFFRLLEFILKHMIKMILIFKLII